MKQSRIGILGIGQMGSSAAVCFARAGFPVTVWARNPKKLQEFPSVLEKLNVFLDQHIGPATHAPGNIELTNDLTVINQSTDFILECVAEDVQQKSDLLKRLQPAAQRQAIIASCTSGLCISDIASETGIANRMVGAHFWNPPHLMPLVEVIRSEDTDLGLEQRTCDLLRAAGKLPVICKDVPGFIGNRLQHAMWREAFHLVENGVCSAEDVDLVARLTFALRLPAIGPCENVDIVGAPLVSNIQSYLLRDLSNAQTTMPAIQGLIDSGNLGMKSGKGFYDWSQRDPARALQRRDLMILQILKAIKDLPPESSE